VSTLITLLLVLGGFSIPFAILAYLLFFPEKIEIWSSLIWKAISHIKAFATIGRKRYVKHDLQGRLNRFTRGLSDEAPYLTAKRVQVQWTEAQDVTRKGFLQEGKVIVRLRRDDPTEANFVHATYLFVSISLLHRLKRYVSPSQKQAVDLKVTTDYLRAEKPRAVGLFLDEYLHPKTSKAGAKIPELLASFEKIDEGGLFYQVLLQELEFLGDKVFLGAKHRNTKVIVEVTKAIEFLERVARRTIGEEVPLYFDGTYCCFAIMIAGKRLKMTPSGEVYVKHIEKNLIPKDIETLYILGMWENRNIIDNVCAAVEDTFERYRTHRSKVTLTYKDGDQERRESREQYLTILRRRGIDVFRTSE
jgi:hypothetical protein